MKNYQRRYKWNQKKLLKYYKLVYEISEKDKEAVTVVLNHLTKQEKMIDRMAKALHLFIWKNDEKIMITSKPKVSCQTLSIEEIKQYFELSVKSNIPISHVSFT